MISTFTKEKPFIHRVDIRRFLLSPNLFGISESEKGGTMADNKEDLPAQLDVNDKMDACIDLTVRRFVYSAFGGAVGGLLLFRSPVTRWASVAFGAGLGIGSAYTDCSRLFQGSSSTAKMTSGKIVETPASQDGHD